MGAGKGYSCVFGVIMGTGVGGGIVINKTIWQGPQNIAGEWGHTVIDPQGPRCFCGAKGCISCFISGAGLEKKIFIETGKKISAQNFFKLKVINSQFKEIKQDFFNKGYFDQTHKKIKDFDTVAELKLISSLRQIG